MLTRTPVTTVEARKVRNSPRTPCLDTQYKGLPIIGPRDAIEPTRSRCRSMSSSQRYCKTDVESKDSPGALAAGIFDTLGLCDLGLRGR